ncbi:MAG: fused MFS/spermidine synthase [Ktedonobacteraceae bacterium]
MSTTTPSPQNASMEEKAVIEPSNGSFQGIWLIVLVLVAGAASLSVEFAASRLLAPYFGTSLFVWANLIGLILLYLTIGYYTGGRIADRYPRPVVLYGLTAASALLISLIPVLSRPILSWSQSAFATYSIGVFYGSLVSVILLFAIPMILLGCVSPFAIRLCTAQVVRSGRTAGQLYAVSTVGSIFGTFFPVFVLIPYLGTYMTFFTTALALLLVSLVGIVSTQRGDGSRGNGLESGKRSEKRDTRSSLFSILLLIPMGLTLFGIQGPIKPPSGTNGGGVLVTEKESAYNYIQVVRVGREMQLVLNEGLAVHSIYNPDRVLTSGPWDYFMVAPYFNTPPFTPQQVRKVCIIGLGAGTIPHEFTNVYGPSVSIDGIEIDGEIVNMGRKYFAMNEPNLHVTVQDGRYFLQTTSQKYDIIGMDAYQQPYVPFQLTTNEFFHEVKDHLTSNGVAVINAGRTSHDFRLVNALSQTMRSVFSNVYIIDTERFSNSIIVGTNAHTALGNFQANTNTITNAPLQSVMNSSINYGNIREEHTARAVFTDDRAPVEQLIDSIILNVATSGKE